jgi:hypothetical protein
LTIIFSSLFEYISGKENIIDIKHRLSIASSPKVSTPNWQIFDSPKRYFAEIQIVECRQSSFRRFDFRQRAYLPYPSCSSVFVKMSAEKNLIFLSFFFYCNFKVRQEHIQNNYKQELGIIVNLQNILLQYRFKNYNYYNYNSTSILMLYNENFHICTFGNLGITLISGAIVVSRYLKTIFLKSDR